MNFLDTRPLYFSGLPPDAVEVLSGAPGSDAVKVAVRLAGLFPALQVRGGRMLIALTEDALVSTVHFIDNRAAPTLPPLL